MESTKPLHWPLCICGHTAQGHNRKLGQEPKNYGCDFCQTCTEYRFPDSVPQEVRDALNARRDAILAELDKPR